MALSDSFVSAALIGMKIEAGWMKTVVNTQALLLTFPKRSAYKCNSNCPPFVGVVCVKLKKKKKTHSIHTDTANTVSASHTTVHIQTTVYVTSNENPVIENYWNENK